MSTRDTLVTFGLLAAGGVAIAAASRGRAGSRSGDVPDLSFAALREGQHVEGGQPYRANGVSFDSRRGAGKTDLNLDVDRRGFIAWLRPSEFLALNPALLDVPSQSLAHEAWLDSLSKGVSLGPPMLKVTIAPQRSRPRWSGDTLGEPLGGAELAVWSHEGRHRMTALHRLSDEPVPVHVVDLDMRTKYLGGLDLDALRFRSDADAEGPVRFIRPHAVALDGVVHLVRHR